MDNTARQHYFDFLRVFAIFAVIVIHASTRTHASTVSQSVFGFYASVSRWAIPIFLMISGALFLSRDIPVRKLYGKYIFRIFTAFVFWSSVYAFAVYAETKDIAGIVPNILIGHYHLWFLPMITSIYMLVPFLKKITEYDFLTKYFLVLTLIFVFMLPDIVATVSIFSEHYAEVAKKFLRGFHMHFVYKYVGYFVFGFFMSQVELSKRAERVIYLLSMFGFVMYIFRVNVGIKELLCTVAVFTLFKKHCPRNDALRETFRILSKYSFGIYLMHEAVIQVLRKAGLDVLTFNPVFSVPVISVIVFVISMAISAILNHIPFLKKYIV